MGKPSLWKVFGTSRKKEIEGVTFEYPGDVRVTLARAGGANENFSKSHERHMRPYRKMQNLGESLPADKQREIIAQVYLDSIVRSFETNVSETDTPNWQPVIIWEDGTETPADRENLSKLFKMVPDLLNQIIQDSNDLASYRKEQLEEDSKN